MSRAWLMILGCALATPALADTAADVMARVRATYSNLKSYADQGSVVTEDGSGAGAPLIETHTFRTRYQAPRQFLLEFHKASGEQYVIWGEGTDFQTWWSATRVHALYPKGKGASAFAVSALPTKDAVTIIAPLLFASSGLQGALTGFTPVEPVGTETVAGHATYKLTGRLGLAYGTGNVTGARAATLWVDTQTLLVRKILEDTPAGSGQGVISRVTMTFTPEANPALSAAQFHFAAPGEPAVASVAASIPGQPEPAGSRSPASSAMATPSGTTATAARQPDNAKPSSSESTLTLPRVTPGAARPTQVPSLDVN